MSNFKSGSGNLDFGGSGGGSEEDREPDETAEDQDEERIAEADVTEQSTTDSLDTTTPDTERSSGREDSDQSFTDESTSASNAAADYPYFVRRNNVGDERDTRLEIHVRDKVADREAKFRNELAEQLDSNEVSKTDAREFALLAAFHHPEQVAELMREEGFGALD